MQGTIASRLLGKVQDAVRGQRNTWRHLKLPEEQPDGVNKRPEIVVAINFGAGVEANVSKYLSEFIARRRQISKQDSYYIDRLARKNHRRTPQQQHTKTQRSSIIIHTAQHYFLLLTQ